MFSSLAREFKALRFVSIRSGPGLRPEYAPWIPLMYSLSELLADKTSMTYFLAPRTLSVKATVKGKKDNDLVLPYRVRIRSGEVAT